jgi:hypothetical protein
MLSEEVRRLLHDARPLLVGPGGVRQAFDHVDAIRWPARGLDAAHLVNANELICRAEGHKHRRVDGTIRGDEVDALGFVPEAGADALATLFHPVVAGGGRRAVQHRSRTPERDPAEHARQTCRCDSRGGATHALAEQRDAAPLHPEFARKVLDVCNPVVEGGVLEIVA